MAKGNMLLGYSQGSVGDVTFYRSGGSQRARARNRNPNNPRSSKQQTQRALFANCVKFYKLTVSKFFKFAFENKKTNESDYNAFMRENLKRGVMISKTGFYTEAYPALGNWLMSRGSLSTIRNAADSNTNAPIFDLGATYSETPSASTTIAEISTAMVASGRYQVGDIITIVRYLANGDNIPTATPNAETDLLQTNFVFWQFLVDPNNTNTFSSIFGDLARYHVATTSSNTLALEFGTTAAAGGEEWRLGYQGTTIIHSRNTSTGLRVSTQELTINPRMTQAIETAATDANYKSAVLADWSAEGLAILQGEGLNLVDPFRVGGVADVSLYNGSTLIKAFAGSTALGSTLAAISSSNLDKITLHLSGSNAENFSDTLLSVVGASGVGVTATETDDYLDVTISFTALTDADKSLSINYNGANIVNIEMHTSNIISISDGANVDLPYSYVSGVITRACILDGDVESTAKKVVVKSYEPIDPVGIALYYNEGQRYTGEISVRQSGNTLTVEFAMGTTATRNASMCYLEDRNSTEIVRFYPFASILTCNSYGIWDNVTTDPVKVFP